MSTGSGSRPRPRNSWQWFWIWWPPYDRLIAAFAEKCKTVEYKVHGDREVYIIDAAMDRSVNGCPIAVIKGWRGGSLFREREVEICECKERYRR